MKQLIKSNEKIPFVITEMIQKEEQDGEILKLLLLVTKNLSIDRIFLISQKITFFSKNQRISFLGSTK